MLAVAPFGINAMHVVKKQKKKTKQNDLRAKHFQSLLIQTERTKLVFLPFILPNMNRFNNNNYKEFKKPELRLIKNDVLKN